MRKITVFFVSILMVSAALALPHSIINPEDLSLKAGPTEPGEELSLVWVEALVYPKVVKEERILSLGVKLTSKVESVTAAFDFSREKVLLTSYDGMNWSGAHEIPEEVSAGLHMVRYEISSARGSIQRTLDFFVEEPSRPLSTEEEASKGEVLETAGWPLTIVSSCTALAGGKPRLLSSGERVTGLSKVPWYKVIFADGKEGWVPGSMVKEPLEEYCVLGYEAYRDGKYAAAIRHYKNTVEINPQFAKGYFWLAKCYYASGDLEGAYRNLMEAMRLDEREINSKIFANTIAHNFFRRAHSKFKSARYHEAIASYQKVLELKPASVSSWIEMGQSYEKLAFPLEARRSFREALKVDPENKEIHALLKIDSGLGPVANLPVKPSKEIPPLLADDSLKIVRSKKTEKGTRIETALKSVVALTKSLGTPVVEKGWEIKKKGERFLVAYICEQGKGVLESFEWLVDIDTQGVSACNDNARLLMSRW